jgi:Protein of unknown function (DUF2510)
LVLLGLLLVGVLAIAAIIAGIVLAVRAASKSSARPPYPQQVPAMPVPPGWYPDHGNPNLMRYFDGREWTSSTQPRN